MNTKHLSPPPSALSLSHCLCVCVCMCVCVCVHASELSDDPNRLKDPSRLYWVGYDVMAYVSMSAESLFVSRSHMRVWLCACVRLCSRVRVPTCPMSRSAHTSELSDDAKSVRGCVCAFARARRVCVPVGDRVSVCEKESEHPHPPQGF